MAGIANSQVDAASAAGARLTWDAAALPTLVQWEMANVAGHYVIGLEPSTALISAATDGAQFPTLESGQSKRLGVAIELLHGAAGRDLLSDDNVDAVGDRVVSASSPPVERGAPRRALNERGYNSRDR
jgi:hypothetical protein